VLNAIGRVMGMLTNGRECQVRWMPVAKPDLKTVWIALVVTPCCLRVRSVKSVCAHDASRLSTCCLTENFRLIVTPSAFIVSARAILGIADTDISTARRLLGGTKTISNDFLKLSKLTKLFSAAHSSMWYFCNTWVNIVSHWSKSS